MSSVTSIEDLKHKLGKTADELTFYEEPDIIVCKPKKYIRDRREFREFAVFMEDCGGPYRPGTGFVFRKVSPVATSGFKSPETPPPSSEAPTAKPVSKAPEASGKKLLQQKALGKGVREPGAEKPTAGPEPAAGFEPAVGFEPTTPKEGSLAERPKRRFEIVPVNAILSMPFQSRLEAPTEEGLKELITSFRSHGILMPVLVRPRPDGLYELVAGGRRFTAAKKADFEVIPAIVREMTDQEAYEAHLIENLQRKDLTDYEKARMLDYLLKRFPKAYPTQAALAKKIGKSEAWLSLHLKMLKLEHLYPGKDLTRITEHQAREIIAAPPEKRGEIIKRIEEGGIPSVREIRKLVKPPEEAPGVPLRAEVSPVTGVALGAEETGGPPTEERDALLDRASKYYPLPLIDGVWQRVAIEARRLRFLRVIVEVLWDWAVQKGFSEQVLERAKERFETESSEVRRI